MWKVNSCCGCCSIKKGIVIIGLLSILIGVSFAVDELADGEFDWSAPIEPIVFFVTGMLLIFGAKKRKSEFVFPSLCLYFVTVIYCAPCALINTIQSTVEDNASFKTFTIEILVMFLICGSCIHAFSVINTLYEELIREKYTVSEIDNSVDVQTWNTHQYQYL